MLMLMLYAKAFHVIAIIAWMAALLYLPRLFVYHASVPPESRQSEMLKVMERRLLRYIATPAMLASWASGLMLVFFGSVDLAHAGWLHLKILLVLALSGFHGFLAVCTKKFGREANRHSEKFYRVINEAPTALMIAIVILVIVRPF